MIYQMVPFLVILNDP